MCTHRTWRDAARAQRAAATRLPASLAEKEDDDGDDGDDDDTGNSHSCLRNTGHHLPRPKAHDEKDSCWRPSRSQSYRPCLRNAADDVGNTADNAADDVGKTADDVAGAVTGKPPSCGGRRVLLQAEPSLPVSAGRETTCLRLPHAHLPATSQQPLVTRSDVTQVKTRRQRHPRQNVTSASPKSGRDDTI